MSSASANEPKLGLNVTEIPQTEHFHEYYVIFSGLTMPGKETERNLLPTR